MTHLHLASSDHDLYQIKNEYRIINHIKELTRCALDLNSVALFTSLVKIFEHWKDKKINKCL